MASCRHEAPWLTNGELGGVGQLHRAKGNHTWPAGWLRAAGRVHKDPRGTCSAAASVKYPCPNGLAGLQTCKGVGGGGVTVLGKQPLFEVGLMADAVSCLGHAHAGRQGGCHCHQAPARADVDQFALSAHRGGCCGVCVTQLEMLRGVFTAGWLCVCFLTTWQGFSAAQQLQALYGKAAPRACGPLCRHALYVRAAANCTGLSRLPRGAWPLPCCDGVLVGGTCWCV